MRNTCLLVLLALVAMPLHAADEGESRYVAKRPAVPLRASPAADAVVLAQLTPDEPVTVLSEGGSFTRVRTVSGMDGWLRAQDLVSDSPASVQLQAAQARVAELESSVASLQRQLRAARAQASQASAELDDRAQDAQAELEKLQRDMEGLQQEMTALREHNAGLEAEIAEYELAERSRRMLAQTESSDGGGWQRLRPHALELLLLAFGLLLAGLGGGYAWKARRVRQRLHGMNI